jgi:hypothetical protein
MTHLHCRCLLTKQSMTATRDCTCLGHFGWCDTEKDHIHYFSHLAKRWKIGGPLLNFSLGICGLIFFGQMREVHRHLKIIDCLRPDLFASLVL